MILNRKSCAPSIELFAWIWSMKIDSLNYAVFNFRLFVFCFNSRTRTVYSVNGPVSPVSFIAPMFETSALHDSILYIDSISNSNVKPGIKRGRKSGTYAFKINSRNYLYSLHHTLRIFYPLFNMAVYRWKHNDIEFGQKNFYVRYTFSSFHVPIWTFSFHCYF